MRRAQKEQQGLEVFIGVELVALEIDSHQRVVRTKADTMALNVLNGWCASRLGRAIS